MLIGITKKLRDKFKYINVEKIEERPEEIFCWHTSHFIHHRLTGLHIMNNKTRYSVILYNIKKKDIENIDEVFKTQLKDNLLMDGIDELTIHKYLKDLGEISFVKTNNRSILGQLNDSFYHLQADVEVVGTIMKHDLDYLNSRTNDIPMIPLERDGYYPFPNRAMKQELERRYKSNIL